MKKKLLLLMVLAMAFACLFVICASASDRTTISYTDASGVTHSVPVVKYDDATAEGVASVLGNNATVQARFVDNSSYAILKATDGTLTAYPTWYIIEPSGSSETYVAISEIEYTYVNSKSGKTYERGAIRYVEFPEGMTHVRNNSVFGLKQSSTPYETNVTDFVLPSTIVAIEQHSFNSMPYLKNVYIKPGNKITTIMSSTFSNSTVQYVQFENLTELETVNGFTSTNLTGDLDLSRTKLKTIGDTCFQNNPNLGKITLPDCLEVIEDGAFEKCGSAYLSSPYLPKSLKSVGNRFFSYNNNLNETYIFPEGVTSLGNEAFQDSQRAGGPTGKSLNVVFLGKVTGVVYLNGGGHQKHADVVTVYFAQNSLSEYNTNGFYIKPSGSSVTSVPKAIRAVFCSGNGAVELSYITSTAGTSFTEDMANDESYGFVMDGHTHYTPYALTCASAPVCIVCDIAQVTPHTEGELLSIAYPNGYTTLGNKTFNCTVCEGDFTSEGVADAIYVALGYSYKLDGSGAIKGGYRINQSALDAWKTYNGSENDTLVFGVIIFNPTKLTEQNLQFISTETGKATIASGVVQVQVESTYQYTSISFNVAGITTSTYESLELVFAGYALELDKYDTISYAQTVYDQGSDGPVANTYTRDGVTLHSVTASKIDALDGTIEGIANN